MKNGSARNECIQLIRECVYKGEVVLSPPVALGWKLARTSLSLDEVREIYAGQAGHVAGGNPKGILANRSSSLRDMLVEYRRVIRQRPTDERARPVGRRRKSVLGQTASPALLPNPQPDPGRPRPLSSR